MSMPEILAYLEAHPEGATPDEIARAIDGNKFSVCDSLGRLHTRGKVEKMTPGRSRLHVVWRHKHVERVSVFKGAETLAAMQAACRARLVGKTVLEAA